MRILKYAKAKKIKSKRSKRNLYNNKIENLKQNNKSIWDVVNEIVNKNKKQSIDEDIEKAFAGKEITEIVNDFNENFSKQVPELKKMYKDGNEQHKRGDFAKELNKKKIINKKTVKKSMYIEEPNKVEIQNLIMEMNNTKATGYDKIQTEHLKQTKDNTSVAICILINAMIKNETWPETLKIQVIRPIYKKGVKNNLNNYRPIVLLSNVDKILENFFANRIRNFLEKNKILTTAQFGYTKNKSTTDLLIEVNED